MTDTPHNISPELENNYDTSEIGGDCSDWECPDCGCINYSHGTDVTCIKCTSKKVIGVDPELEPPHNLGRLSRSRGEERCTDVLNDLGITFETEKSFPTCRDKKALRFDFYLPEYNLLIEYDGAFHTKLVRWSRDTDAEAELDAIKRRDAIKDTWAKDNGYNLVRITNKQFKHIDKLINFWVDLAESDALNGSEKEQPMKTTYFRDDETLVCVSCNKFTTGLEANRRKFNTDRCGYCGGYLKAPESFNNNKCSN